MKILLSVFIIALTCLLLVSCQKEVHGDIPQEVNPGNKNDSTLLSKYIEFDTTLPSGSDTIYQFFCAYDYQNRLKRFYSLDDSQESETADYFYNGTDTLPNKIVDVWTNYGDIYRDTTFFIYTDGKVSYDSSIEYEINTTQFNGTNVASFTATAGGLSIQTRHYSLPFQLAPTDQGSDLMVQTYQDGNIAMQDDAATGLLQFSGYRHQEAKYDNKPNPFYKVILPYPFLNKLIVQKNNVLEENSWDDPSYPATQSSYSYTYRQDGYPLIVRVTNQGYLGGWKALFFYTK